VVADSRRADRFGILVFGGYLSGNLPTDAAHLLFYAGPIL
jgi:hypothetical protein